MGYEFPVYSLTSVAGEKTKHFEGGLYARTQTLPDVEAWAKKWWTPFSFRSRKIKKEIFSAWGVEGGRRRAAEAAWLGPRLRDAGVRHLHVHFAGRAARTAFWVWRHYGIPYSLTAHANDFFVDSPGLFLGDLFREAKFVVTVSDFSVRQLCGRFPESAEKMHRVYNGIDTASFAKSVAEKEKMSRPSIVSVGRYIEKKGYSDLIQACALLEDLDFDCYLIGEGAGESAMREQIMRLGLGGKVHVTGPKSEGQIRDFLHQARVFALACSTESDGGMDNLPTVIMEAMAAELPVVSTRLAGVPEMVEERKTGLLVEEHAVPALAGALREMLEDRAKAEAMGKEGAAVARVRFDSRATSAELERLFFQYGVMDDRRQ